MILVSDQWFISGRSDSQSEARNLSTEEPGSSGKCNPLLPKHPGVRMSILSYFRLIIRVQISAPKTSLSCHLHGSTQFSTQVHQRGECPPGLGTTSPPYTSPIQLQHCRTGISHLVRVAVPGPTQGMHTHQKITTIQWCLF